MTRTRANQEDGDMGARFLVSLAVFLSGTSASQSSSSQAWKTPPHGTSWRALGSDHEPLHLRRNRTDLFTASIVAEIVRGSISHCPGGRSRPRYPSV